jgi:hypothetical protein
MATTTPIYGFDVPTSTDYVKDGATAIETLGDDVDAMLGVALNSKTQSGLSLIKTQTIGTAVSSVVVTGAFNANYENYRVVINGIVGSSASDLLIAFGGATNHYGSTSFDSYTGSPVGVNRRNNAASLFIGGFETALGEQSVSLDIFAPFLTRSTGIAGNYYGNKYSGFIGGTYASTTSLTQFTLSAFVGTLTGGKIAIYGYGIN